MRIEGISEEWRYLIKEAARFLQASSPGRYSNFRDIHDVKDVMLTVSAPNPNTLRYDCHLVALELVDTTWILMDITTDVEEFPLEDGWFDAIDGVWRAFSYMELWSTFCNDGVTGWWLPRIGGLGWLMYSPRRLERIRVTHV